MLGFYSLSLFGCLEVLLLGLCMFLFGRWFRLLCSWKHVLKTYLWFSLWGRFVVKCWTAYTLLRAFNVSRVSGVLGDFGACRALA